MSKNKHCILRIIATMLLAILVIPETTRASDDPTATRYRALLIACDQFVEATEMTPIGENNLRIMEQVLSQDVRGFEIKRQYGITSTKEMLAHAVDWAFGGATQDDVSLLYISTHGDFITTQNNPYGVLLLSDGALQESITAQELNEILDRIPGTKVLLVDACNSGSLIAKGVSPDVGAARVARTFQSDGYKVLTSSGASEPSWYLQPTLEHAPPGSSYFTTALAVGAGLVGDYAADINRDNVITLSEMYDHLWTAQASSTVQMYPQDDEFPLFVYDRASRTDASRGELTGFVFGPMALVADHPALEIAYTVTTPTRIAYRITYLRNGKWDWANGQTIHAEMPAEDGSSMTADITPGRKEVRLALDTILPEDWTYAMIHVMTLGNMDDGKQPFIYASRVFSALRPQNNPNLSVRAASCWNPGTARELELFVRHDVPCKLSISIQDAEGALVRRLGTSRNTRPQSLVPDGSLYYWNGLDANGAPVAPGDYTIHVAARIADSKYEATQSITIE